MVLFYYIPSPPPAAVMTSLHLSHGFRCDPLSNEHHQSSFPEGENRALPTPLFLSDTVMVSNLQKLLELNHQNTDSPLLVIYVIPVCVSIMRRCLKNE